MVFNATWYNCTMSKEQRTKRHAAVIVKRDVFSSHVRTHIRIRVVSTFRQLFERNTEHLLISETEFISESDPLPKRNSEHA